MDNTYRLCGQKERNIKMEHGRHVGCVIKQVIAVYKIKLSCNTVTNVVTELYKTSELSRVAIRLWEANTIDTSLNHRSSSSITVKTSIGKKTPSEVHVYCSRVSSTCLKNMYSSA